MKNVSANLFENISSVTDEATKAVSSRVTWIFTIQRSVCNGRVKMYRFILFSGNWICVKFKISRWCTQVASNWSCDPDKISWRRIRRRSVPKLLDAASQVGYVRFKITRWTQILYCYITCIWNYAIMGIFEAL